MCCWGKQLPGFPHVKSATQMAATPKRARISALIAFSRYEDQNASEKLLHNIQLTLLWKTDQVILSKTNLTNFIGKI